MLLLEIKKGLPAQGYFVGLTVLTRRRDQTVKLEAYRDAGVPEYWLVDPTARTVVGYVLEKGRYAELIRGGEKDVVWSAVVPGFRLKIRSLFPSQLP